MRQSGAGPQAARLGRQIGRVDGVLQQRLYAGYQHAGPATTPGCQRRDTRGRLVGHELTALVGERSPRLQHGNGGRVAQPGGQLLGHPIADLRVARDPADPLTGGEHEGRREERFRAMGNSRDRRMATARRRALAGRSEPLAEARERPGRREEPGQPGKIRQPAAGARRVTGDRRGWRAGSPAAPAVRCRAAGGRVCGDRRGGRHGAHLLAGR